MLFNHNFLVISALFWGWGAGKSDIDMVIGSVRPSVSSALSFFGTILFNKKHENRYFLKKRQNLQLSSAANYRWRFKG